MAILLTCRVLRADEDEGLVEILRATGAGRSVPFLVPVTLVWVVVAALSAGGRRPSGLADREHR